MSAVPRVLHAAAIVLLVAAHGAAQSQHWELYDSAVADVKQRRWQEARRKLEAAKKVVEAKNLRVQNGRLHRSGNTYSYFFPDFYLGVVDLNLGDYDAALAHFARARSAGVSARTDPSIQDISQLEAAAREQLRRVADDKAADKAAENRAAENRAAETKAAETKVAESKAVESKAVENKAAENKVESKTVDTKPAEKKPGALTPDYSQQVAAALGRARGELERRDFTRAQQTATGARMLALEHSLADQRAQADSLLREIAGRRLTAVVEGHLTRRDAPAARRELDALVREVPGYPSESLRARVARLEAELQSTALQRDAILEYYRGRYAQSLALLAKAASIAPLPPRALFYRACGLTALVEVSPGTRDASLLAEARSYYRDAAAAPEQFADDLSYISPKVRRKLGIRER
jgi:hypothetical protein